MRCRLFVLGQPGQLVHKIGLLIGESAFGHRRQHRVPQAQGADLRRQGFGVRRGGLGKGELPVDNLADHGEVQSQAPQGPYEVQARDGIDAVEAVAWPGCGPSAPRFRDRSRTGWS